MELDRRFNDLKDPNRYYYDLTILISLKTVFLSYFTLMEPMQTIIVYRHGR